MEKFGKTRPEDIAAHIAEEEAKRKLREELCVEAFGQERYNKLLEQEHSPKQIYLWARLYFRFSKQTEDTKTFKRLILTVLEVARFPLNDEEKDVAISWRHRKLGKIAIKDESDNTDKE